MAGFAATHLPEGGGDSHMVTETEEDGTTWYECELCGLTFDSPEDAREHEKHCDAEEPSYIQ
jgi:hypothetical protein